MNRFKVLGLLCLVMGMTTITSPLPLADNNAFTDFLRDTQLNAPPSLESIVVKRRIFEDNVDTQLKQISLSSLLGDLEKNMFASAVSLNKVLTTRDVDEPDIKVNNDSQHDDVNQPQMLIKEETANSELPIPAATTTTASITTSIAESLVTMSPNDKMILPTTEKVIESSAVPTHIVIDRIAIQPHTGGLTLIPIFELKRTRKDEDSNKDHEITKIKISKTEITSLATSAALETSTSSSTTTTSSTSTDTSTTTTTTETPTTPKNIEQLKEAEEELQEKVAEIEADPIILSARV